LVFLALLLAKTSSFCSSFFSPPSAILHLDQWNHNYSHFRHFVPQWKSFSYHGNFVPYVRYFVYTFISILPFRTISRSAHYHKIFVKFRESKKNVLKIVLIIVNINKDENKSLISNQFSLKIIVISYHSENHRGRLFIGPNLVSVLFLYQPTILTLWNQISWSWWIEIVYHLFYTYIYTLIFS
jgi:hypothetical protein